MSDTTLFFKANFLIQKIPDFYPEKSEPSFLEIYNVIVKESNSYAG